MDLLTLLFRLPFLPLTGVIRLAEIIRDQAEGELHDPASVRRELEAAEAAAAAGEMSDRDLEEVQRAALGRVVRTPASPPGPGAAPQSSTRVNAGPAGR